MDEIYNLIEDIKGTTQWLWEIVGAILILVVPVAIIIYIATM
jgi:hypothetical protein